MRKKQNLVALDQQPLRMSAISELESWHDKIELLEIEIQKFHDTDFKLYNDWLQLMLGDLQAETNLLFDQYKKLALFHNWVVFTVKEKNISLPHAFFLMSEEELNFQKGSKEEKELIEKLRKDRTNKINAELNSEPEVDFNDGEDEFDSEFESESVNNRDNDQFNDEPLEDGDWIQNREREIRLQREHFKNEILIFESLTDKKLTKIMRQFGEGLDFISRAVYVCSQCYRFDIVERIWKFVPFKMKTHFNADFKNQMGVTLDQYLINIKNDAQRSSSSDENDEEFNFKAHFENPFSTPINEVLPENVEAAKIVYRRIMMKIHPDKLSTEFVTTKKNWLDRLWKKIQTAHDKKDVKALQNLHLQVLVNLKKYDELDYSDLKAGSKLLQSELLKIEKSQEETLQHPAWGFSKLKSYKKLEKTIAEPYKQNSKNIKKDIKRIEGIHTGLRELVESIQAAGGFGRSRRRKPVQRRKKPQSTTKHSHSVF
jgi:hypothetical protein